MTEQLGKIQFVTLGKWALGASLIHGIGEGFQQKVMEVGALPFHIRTLYLFIEPFSQRDTLSLLSVATSILAGCNFISEAVVHSSSQRELELSKKLKMFHAGSEMIALAAFVTTVVAAIFSIEARRLCMVAVSIHAICYMSRFYRDTPNLKIERERKCRLPEGIFDVTAMMKEKQCAYLGREVFVENVLGVLRSNFETNNPLLVGPAGSGKTELIHYLALKINAGELEGVEGWKVYKTSCKELISNTKYLGELPKKVNQIFNFLRGKKAILFIDEIHQALTDGVTSDVPDGSVAEALLTHLTDPDIRVIAATTFEHERKLHHNEPFRQRFYFFPMPRMSDELRNRILADRLDKLQRAHTDVTIPEDYESFLSQCLESKGERRGLRALIALLSVVVEQMDRTRISFREALQQDIDRALEMKVGALESQGMIASDDFISNLKAKVVDHPLFGIEFRVLALVFQKIEADPAERSLDVHLRKISRIVL